MNRVVRWAEGPWAQGGGAPNWRLQPTSRRSRLQTPTGAGLAREEAGLKRVR